MSEQEIDVLVGGGGGSVFIVRPLTELGRAWIDENIGENNGHQPYYPSIVVEHKFIADIVEGMRFDGLNVKGE